MMKCQIRANFLFAVLTVIMVSAFLADQSAADTGNLLLNPGAEDTTTRSDKKHWYSRNCWGAIESGWYNDGALEYARSGDWFWFGATNNNYAELWQDYVLPSEYKQAVRDAIDEPTSGWGGAYAHFGGWLMSWGGE